jgi:hypothetical protein
MVEERAFFTRLYPWDNCFYPAQNKPEKKLNTQFVEFMFLKESMHW